jgi:hypothetical protein
VVRIISLLHLIAVLTSAGMRAFTWQRNVHCLMHLDACQPSLIFTWFLKTHFVLSCFLFQPSNRRPGETAALLITLRRDPCSFLGAGRREKGGQGKDGKEGVVRGLRSIWKSSRVVVVRGIFLHIAGSFKSIRRRLI